MGASTRSTSGLRGCRVLLVHLGQHGQVRPFHGLPPVSEQEAEKSGRRGLWNRDGALTAGRKGNEWLEWIGEPWGDIGMHIFSSSPQRPQHTQQFVDKPHAECAGRGAHGKRALEIGKRWGSRSLHLAALESLAYVDTHLLARANPSQAS